MAGHELAREWRTCAHPGCDEPAVANAGPGLDRFCRRHRALEARRLQERSSRSRTRARDRARGPVYETRALALLAHGRRLDAAALARDLADAEYDDALRMWRRAVHALAAAEGFRL